MCLTYLLERRERRRNFRVEGIKGATPRGAHIENGFSDEVVGRRNDRAVEYIVIIKRNNCEGSRLICL